MGQENRRAARVVTPKTPHLHELSGVRRASHESLAPTTCLIGGGRMEEGGWGGDARGRVGAAQTSLAPIHRLTRPLHDRFRKHGPTNGGAPTTYGSFSLTVRCVARARGGSSCGAAPRE